MIKVIDTDKLFDDYISDYVYSNIGKIKPEEIENQMPVLYEKFGDTPIDRFYSDSFSDTPLARLAAKAFMVDEGEISEWDFTQEA